MSLEVLLTVLGLFAPLIIAALVAYGINKYDMAKTAIVGLIADVVVIAVFGSWTAGNWTIYNEEAGGVVWIPIAILWILFSFLTFIAIDSLIQYQTSTSTTVKIDQTVQDTPRGETESTS